MKICITGASSSVAEKIIEQLNADHDLTLLDVQYRPYFTTNVPKLTGSILDRTFLMQAFKGQDAIIHAAIAHEDKNTTDEERWRVNMEGTLAVVQEAVAAHIKKFIYTSSLSVLDGYDLREREPGAEEVEPKQSSFYGLTKYLGELIVKFYAEKTGMKSVTLRLVAVTPGNEDLGENHRWKFEPIFRTSGRDVARAFQLALEKNLDSNYEIFHISGGYPKRFWSHEKAKRLLGYHPLDTWEKTS